METFITELSSVIRNWPADRVIRTMPAPAAVVLVSPALAISPLGCSRLGRASRWILSDASPVKE